MIDNRRGVRVAWIGAKSGNTGHTGNTLGRYWIAAGGAGRDGNGRASAEPGAAVVAECESIAKSTASAGNAQIGLIFQWTACR